MALTATKYLKRVTPEFVREVATGIEDGKDIAKRYGIAEDEWRVIESRSDFQAEVTKLRTEMERSGQTFRTKAHIMADKLMDDMFTHAIGADVPVKDKAAALQLLTRVADLEPKASAQVQAGPGFSITINLPIVPPKEDEVVEETGEVVDIVSDSMSLNFGDNNEEKPVQRRPEEDLAEAQSVLEGPDA